MADRPHAPSQARAIAQEAKGGGDAARLSERARAVEDPYHAAWALAHVAAHGELAPERMRRLLQETGVLARRVPEPWRRAELVAELGRILLLPDGDPGLREGADPLLVELVATLEPGKALSAAVQGLAPRLARRRFAELLAASRRGGNAAEDGKAIVAAWAQDRPDSATAEILATALGTLDPAARARVLGHLHLQAGRARLRLPFSALERAAAAAGEVAAEAERTEVLRLLSLDATAIDDLRLLSRAAPPSPAARGRLLNALAAQADRLGDPALSEAWFLEAAAASDAAGDSRSRAALRRNAAQGLRRLGNAAEADRLQALADAERATAPKPEAPASSAPQQEASAPVAPAVPPPGGRPILALHNAYDGGLGKPHLQAVARAAPLAVGFGLDLALVGFPAEDAADLVRRAEADTQVADGRGLASRLLAEGRLLLVPRDVHGQPHRWGIANTYVATTQDPDARKPADLEALLARGRLCLILGLGSRGLPKQLLDATPHHLELTGAKVPLETATVMGVAAERLGALTRREPPPSGGRPPSGPTSTP